MKLMKICRQAILSEIDKHSWTRKALVQVLTIAFLCGSSWYFYLGPEWGKIEYLQEEVLILDQDMSRLSRQTATLSQIEETLEIRQRELVLAKALLSEDVHALERLLASLERLGDEKNICFLLFQPGSEKFHQYYASRKVQLRLQGNFHDLISYFDELTRLESLISLQSLRLNPVSGQQGEDVHLAAEAMLKVYRLLSSSEKKDRRNG